MVIKAVAVAVPGIAHPRTGRVWAPNLQGWDDYPLRDEVRDAFSDPGVKFVVESDRAAYILGEAWQGAARGCRDAIFLAVGTGIGAGILTDGRVLRGPGRRRPLLRDDHSRACPGDSEPAFPLPA